MCMKNIKKSPLWYFLMIAPFAAGGFYEYISCIFSVLLLIYILVCRKKNGYLLIYKNIALFSLTVPVLFYGISLIWAVDHGMSVLGFIKFLPLPLFAIAVMQQDAGNRKELFHAVPISGILMTVLSLLLGCLPRFQDMLWVNGRLAGFFQYPNTYAVYLLSGIVIILGRKCLGKQEWFSVILLLLGIMMSGSRTVFFLLLIVLTAYIILLKNKKTCIWMALILGFIVILTGAYAALSGDVASVGRYLTSSLTSSTFVGRLLYFKDAIPVILKHPFGLGYLGYYFSQGSFQTGVYSIQNVHNELLQILLDVGWIPCGFLIAALIQTLYKCKDMSIRILVLVAFMHCMLDFDIQFVAFAFILILPMDLESGSCIRWKHSVMSWEISSILTALSVWIGIASFFYYRGDYNTAIKVYPFHTNAWCKILEQTDNIDEMEEAANQIIRLNSSVSLAYSAKAKMAYADGDFAAMIEYKQRAISLAKYNLEEYLDYFDMLYIGAELYSEAGDVYSAQYCRERLLEIPDMIQDVLDETDSLAWKINDLPELDLPEKYLELLETVEPL